MKSFWYISLFLFVACGNTSEQHAPIKESIPVEDTLTTTLLPPQEVKDTLASNPTIATMEFTELIHSMLDSITSWKFIPKNDSLIISKKMPGDEHWLLDKFRKITHSKDSTFLARFPDGKVSEEDYLKIQSIEQAHFKINTTSHNNKDLTIEVWHFNNEESALWWWEKLNVNRRNYFTKPPKYQLQKGNKLFVVSTRAAMWTSISRKVLAYIEAHP